MPGSYTGASGIANLRFFVSLNHRQLQDVDTGLTRMFCAPPGGRAYYDEDLTIGVAPLTATGYFSAKGSQPVVVITGRGTLSYVFTGYVKNSGGAGDLILTLTYTDSGTHYTCRPTSSDISWTATRDDQPTQTNALPAGTYTNAEDASYTIGLKFFVKDRTHLGHVDTGFIRMFCAPPGGSAYYDEKFSINSIPLNSDGSFSGKASRTVNLTAGATGTLTDTFQGHFHSIGPRNAARAAGILNPTLTLRANNTSYWCTDTTYWVATLGGK